MKRFILPLALFAATTLLGQQAPLTVHTDVGAHGYGQAYYTAQHVNRLRPEYIGQVSALDIADGYTVILFDGEDGEGRDQLTITGPQRIEDLKTQVRLHGSGNWDNAIRSLVLFQSNAGIEQIAPSEIAANPN
ncbi:MAG: hypothetical protein R2815_12400 [Flavobacteriales bacterium]